MEDAIHAAVAETAASLEAASASETTDTSTAAPADASTATTEQGADESKVVASEAEAEDGTEAVSSAGKPRGPIPYDRHQAVLTKARREYEAKQAEFETKLKELEWATQQGVREKLTVAELIETNPELLISVLKQDERYAKLLTPAQAEAVAQSAAKSAPVEDPMPEADLQTPDGMLLYSKDQQAKLLEWNKRQVERDFEAKLDQRLSPFEKARKEQEEAAKADQVWQSHLKSAGEKLKEARTEWELFAESEAEIKALMAKPGNERMSLERAYNLIVLPKFKADRERVRRELVDEMNTATPKSTSLRPGSQSVVPPSSGESIKDIIAAHARRLEGK